ncbi:MAG: PAS-domain containing protein, partial [Alphaproteobacteria bacterium]|nr:PAS-domain containing protein [Alphaproteobacteria bacterium]
LSINLDRIVKANYDVLDNISTAIAIFGENTRLVFFNSAYQKLMKLESVWLHAKPTYSEVLDECRNNRQIAEHVDFQGFKKAELAMFTSVLSPQQELMHLPSGKTLRRLTAPYPLGGLMFVFEDVTDSLALQRKNNTLLAVQKETIDHLQEGILVYGSNNRIKILNASVLKIWDIENKNTDEIKGMHIADLLEFIKEKIDYENNWKEFKDNAISSLTDRTPKTGKLMRKNNSVVMFSYIPLPDGAHMLSFIDVTDTYVVEKAIMEKNLAQKEAHEMRYEFVCGISTELKEPINCLIGFTELLTREYYGSLNQKQKEYCKYILDSSNQLYQLINSLLEMVLIDSESSSLDFSTFVVKDIINEVISIVEKRAQTKNLKIETFYEDPLLSINGDKKRIKQFLFNVLINAIQASPIDGKIEIRTIIEKDNNALKIIIKDERIENNNNTYKVGINRKKTNSPIKTHIRKILASNAASMLLIKPIIEQHGGTLSVNTAPEGGSYVICSLPIKQQDSQDQTEPQEEYVQEKNEEDFQVSKEEQESLKNAVNG